MSIEATGIEAEHPDFLWSSAWKKEFCGGTVRRSFKSLTSGRSRALKTRQIEEIVKL